MPVIPRVKRRSSRQPSSSSSITATAAGGLGHQGVEREARALDQAARRRVGVEELPAVAAHDGLDPQRAQLVAHVLGARRLDAVPADHGGGPGKVGRARAAACPARARPATTYGPAGGAGRGRRDERTGAPAPSRTAERSPACRPRRPRLRGVGVARLAGAAGPWSDVWYALAAGGASTVW